MLIMDNKQLYIEAIKKWGIESHLFTSIAKLAELQQAISKHYKYGIVYGKENVIESIAGVEIALEQLKLILSDNTPDLDNRIKKIKLEKLERLERMLGY